MEEGVGRASSQGYGVQQSASHRKTRQGKGERAGKKENEIT